MMFNLEFWCRKAQHFSQKIDQRDTLRLRGREGEIRTESETQRDKERD